MQQIAFQVTNCMTHHHKSLFVPRLNSTPQASGAGSSPLLRFASVANSIPPGTCCVLDSEQGDLADFRFQIPAHLVLPPPPKFRVLITPLQMR